MMQALELLRSVKMLILGQKRAKIKPITLAVTELRLSEGISGSVGRKFD